jgi:hypothetical protein
MTVVYGGFRGAGSRRSLICWKRSRTLLTQGINTWI